MNWTWMKGANTNNQPGTYGTQGVPAPANTPGARYGAASWTDNAGALWLFGGLGYPASWDGEYYLNDLWKYNPATTNWTWIKGSTNGNEYGTYGAQGVPAPANMPGARDYAVTWTNDSGVLWLFGGLGYDSTGDTGWLNDLWRFDPTTMNWTWMKGANIVNQIGTYGEKGVPAAFNTPGTRYTAVSWTDNSGALWLFGGVGHDASGGLDCLNDLWKFDPVTTNWTWMKGSTNRNEFGTYGEKGVPATVNTPGARFVAVSWTDNLGALRLFGGRGYASTGSLGELNDLWKYDPATTNWTWMKGASITNQPGAYGTQGVADPTNTPGARNGAVSWTDNMGALWLFGGGYFGNLGGWFALNDLWKYNAFDGGILLATNALVFSATCQGVNPTAQTIGITNIGVSGFTYTNVITYSAGASGWLTVLPVNGSVTMNGATVLTNQISITGLGAGTYYATNQVTAADATNSPQTVVVTLTVIGRADPVIVDVAGNWYVWFSGSGYQRGGPWSLGVAGTPVTADFDGDRYADPAVVDDAGNWYVWFTSLGYQMGGPYSLGGSGTPLAADFDGDRYADPAMVGNTDAWYIWFTSAGYRMGGPYYYLGGSGTPIASDFDGDRYADPAMVDSTGAWRVWYTSLGYQMGGPYSLGVSGTPVAADFDGDRYADPAVVDSTGAWYVWYTSLGYQMGGPYSLGVSGTPLAADFDGR